MPLTTTDTLLSRHQRCGVWIDILITQYVPLTLNRWRYNAVEVIVEKDGRYRELPSGVGWSGTAYNALESNNDGAGVEGSGDDVAGLPSGVALKPIGRGAVVQGATRYENASGVVEARFSCPNNVDGRCFS